jgi:putative MATE family efflux protein
MSDVEPALTPGTAPLRGDLTQGPLARTLLVFAVPQLIGNVMQTLNTSINAVWVGRLLGESALAATANANIVMFLLFALIFGFGMAATVRIGQAWGAHDVIGARRAMGTALGLTAILGLSLTTLGWLFAPQLLDALATPGAARAEALDYLRVIFLSVPLAMLMTMIGMALRGAGDATTPLRFMILTSLLDVALNPLLIIGWGPIPSLGITGSALATAIATTIGFASLLAWIYLRDLPLRLRGAELAWLRPQRSELAFILGKGVPMGAQMLVISGAGVIMIGLVNREGIVIAAAYGALLQVWNYMAMPAMAIGGAVSAMVAQYIGAGHAERTDAVSWTGAGANLVITALLVALLLAFDRAALVLFLGSHSDAVDAAIHIQTIAIWTYLPFGVMIVLFGTLRAFGVVYVQLGVLFVSMYLVRYGAYFALYPHIRADALWYSLVLSSIMSLLLTLAVYYVGTWRRTAFKQLSSAARLG